MTPLGALGARLEERLTTHAATVEVDTRNATGALGEFPHAVRL